MWKFGVVVLLLLGGYGGYRVYWHYWGWRHLRAAHEALAHRDWRRAREHLEHYFTLVPDDAQARLAAAQAARRLGDAESALTHLGHCETAHAPSAAVDLEKTLLAAPRASDADLQSLLSSCRARPDAPDTSLTLEALVDAGIKRLGGETTLGLSIDDPLLATELARTNEALDLWMGRQQASEDQAQGLVWRGRLHALAYHAAQARAEFRRALDLSPELFEARMEFALAVAYDTPAEALTHLEWLRARYPLDKHVCFSLATMRRLLGDLQGAAELLDELLASNPNDLLWLLERAYVAMNAKQLGQAESHLRRALLVAPNAPEAHRAMSACLTLAGRSDEAKPFLDRRNILDREQTQRREMALLQRKAALGDRTAGP